MIARAMVDKMIDSQLRLSREQLYELVWSKPLSKLALEYNISDVGLSKMCARMAIPRPAQGYWARRVLGHKDRRPSLPNAGSSVDREVILERRVQSERKSVAQQPPTILVPDTLEGGHPIVVRTVRALERAKPDHRGVISSNAKGVLAIEVSPASKTRALLLLNALVNALEERGHTVSSGSEQKPKTLLEVGGESLSLSLKEHIEQREHQKTLEEQRKEERSGWTYIPRYDYEPSGLLRFKIEGMSGTGTRQTWSDTPRAKLEKKLGHVVAGIETAAAFEHERQLRWAAQRERWERERQEREAERRRIEEEERAAKQIRELAREWKESNEVRDFLQAIERAVPASARTAGFENWLARAYGIADKLDPVKSRLDLPK